MDKLNFSWLVDNEVAGHAEPRNSEDLVWLFEKGIQALVRMSQHPKVSPEEIKRAGLDDLHEPVLDFTAPSQEQLNRMVDFILESVWHGKPVGVSCGAGIGRTGTVLACYLAKRNLTAKGLILEVRRKRPGSVETDEQTEAVDKFLRHTLDVNVDHKVYSSKDVLQCLMNVAEEQKPEYGRGFEHADVVTKLTLSLYRGIEKLKLLPVCSSDSLLLTASGYLHDIGVPYGEPHNVKGFEILKQRLSKTDMQAILSESEKAVILYCVLWHRGNDFHIRPEVSLQLQEQRQALLLASVLRIGDGLCYPSGRPTKRVSVQRQNHTLSIEVCPARSGDSLHTQVNKANEKKDLLEKLLKEKADIGITNVEVRKCTHPGC